MKPLRVNARLGVQPLRVGQRVKSTAHLGPGWGTHKATGTVTRVRASRHCWNVDVRDDANGMIIESIAPCWVDINFELPKIVEKSS